MTVPGLALFYGGLVRTKNMLSMLMQVFFAVCIVCIIWVLYGYSLAFSEGGSLNAYVGGFVQGFPGRRHAGVDGRDVHRRRRNPRVCLHLLPDDLCLHHAGADRRRDGGAHEVLSASSLFIPLWVTFVYFPIAHMVWYWAGPAATVGAAKTLAAADPAMPRPRRSRHGCGDGQRRPRLPAGAHSTSPAARWCTSTPASPGWWARCWSASASASAARRCRRTR